MQRPRLQLPHKPRWLSWPRPPALPSMAGSQDLGDALGFRSYVLTWSWRLFTERFTRPGRWFIWVTAAFGVVGVSSLDLQTYVPLSYCMGLWVVASAAQMLLRPRASLKAFHAERVCAGEALPVDLEVRNTGARPVADLVAIPHRLPPAVASAPEHGIGLPPLAPGERARVRLALRCPRRGVYRLRGFRVQSSFPFGLLNAAQGFPDGRTLVVYPRFTRLARLAIPSGRRYHPGGVALASSLGDSFEYLGNREYRQGDSVRDIDWRSTARLQRPIVREYREEYFLRVAVILDTHVPKGSAPARTEDFERAVSLAASVADYMARQEFLVDIFAAGPDLYHLTAGRSLAYLDQILDILACVEASRTEPFRVIEPEIMEHLSKITTVICVFLDWSESRREFVDRLRLSGAAVKVILSRSDACSLDPDADAPSLGGVVQVRAPEFAAGLEEL